MGDNVPGVPQAGYTVGSTAKHKAYTSIQDQINQESPRWPVADVVAEAKKNADDLQDRAYKATRLAEFLKQNPTFAEFITLVREGSIKF